MAIVGLNGWQVDAYPPPTERWFLPATLRRGSQEIKAVGVWTADADRYVKPAVRALGELAGFQSGGNRVLIGDFNASSRFDHRYPPTSHFSRISEATDVIGLHSAWHHHQREALGAETHASFYLQRKREKAFHIDYAFLSGDLNARVSNIQFGTFGDWVSSGLSDHVPMTIDLAI